MFDAKTFLSHLTSRPGVYIMLDAKGSILYIGKAKNLKNRVTSYFRGQLDARIQAMVDKIDAIDITITHNEKEALLLENELIKTKGPKYNIALRDDKYYPYLFLSAHDVPALVFHRGPHKRKGTYFGPYPSASAVKQTLNLLQKLFKLRQCDDVYFKNRSRPCLQYQIGRCSAPCVDLIKKEDYLTQVQFVTLFLNGQHSVILDKLILQMNEASKEMDYELAIYYRNQIQHIQQVVEQQAVYSQEGDVDVIAQDSAGGQIVFYILFIRQGKMSGTKAFYLDEKKALLSDDLYLSFLGQYYLNPAKTMFPEQIITSFTLKTPDVFLDAIAQKASKAIRLSHAPREQKRRWLNLAQENAKLALKQRMGSKKTYWKRLTALKEALGLKALSRMECFDISHTFGEATVGSCVVFDEHGPQKKLYRAYNIEDGGCDDYRAMSFVLSKRYKKLKEQGDELPELVFVDGGKGQLNIAKKIFIEYQMLDVLLVGVAKGEGRKPGLETLYVVNDYASETLSIVTLSPHSEALHLIQQIRDEAHRFAITRHRAKRDKKRTQSPLESISGVGPKRRQQLLTHFGGQKELLSASEESIAKVSGISKALAKKIYQQLHES